MGGIHAAAASSTANQEGSGISEGLGECAAVLQLGSKGEALSSGSARGDVEQGVSTSKRAKNSLHSWTTSTVSGPTGHLDKLVNKL